MEDSTARVEIPNLVNQVLDNLDSDDLAALSRLLHGLHPADLATLLGALPLEQRVRAWELVPDALSGDILAEVGHKVRETLIRQMDAEALVGAAEGMEVDDLAVVVEKLPPELGDSLVNALSVDVRDRLVHSLTFDEGTAGRLMTQDVVTARADVSVEVVNRYLRMRKSLPPHTDGLMVVSRDDVYQGKASLEALLTSEPETTVAGILSSQQDVVIANASDDAVAHMFERHDLLSCAVVDEHNKLLGRITVDDVVDIIESKASGAMMHMAGLEEDADLFAPPLNSAKRRAIWLGVNLVTAFLAAWVIGLFEGALSQIVALAVLMPIVASMGGIAGSQTLTLTIRGLALNQIASGNVSWLTRKEIVIGIVNGLLWAMVVAGVTLLWYREWGISIVIAVAIIINLFAASFAGIAIPLMLRRLGADPALSGAVILTTLTDVVGFMSFLGLATLFLL